MKITSQKGRATGIKQVDPYTECMRPLIVRGYTIQLDHKKSV